ncbi:MAG: hypothetical protein JWM02_3129 [Frankiales bacterium]|nr:hypothetical protein [Frankiales bacterium]
MAARLPRLAQGLASLAVGAALLGLAVLGELPLLAGVVVVQLLVGLAFLALVDAPASGGVFLLGTTATIGADLVVQLDDGRVGGLAGVVALSLVAGLLHQLMRRERSRVTESLADSFVVVVLACSAACLPAALQHTGGVWPVRASLAAAGVALWAGRVGDAVLDRPTLAVGATRAWPGLLLALGAGVAVASLVASGHLTPGRAALVGLAATATVVAVDLALDLAAAELTTSPADARRVAALRPLSVLLPYALLGPVVLLSVLVVG